MNIKKAKELILKVESFLYKVIIPMGINKKGTEANDALLACNEALAALDEKPVCKICKDTKKIQVSTEEGSPFREPEIDCPFCLSVKPESIDKAYQVWWDEEGRKWADNSGVGKFGIGKVVWQNRQKEIDRLESEIVKKQLVIDSNRSVLANFAREVIRRYCWDSGEVDGGDLQDLAVGFGLLKEHKVLELEAEKYPDSEIGDIIYIFSETLQENNKQYPSNFGEENNNGK